MEASINFDGTLSGAISGGGGGSSNVVITPVVTSGTKIADVSVNGEEKDLYCPNPTAVSVEQVQQSGTKIASIVVNGQSVDLYAPSPTAPTEVSVNQVQQSGTKIASIEVNGVSTDLYAPNGSEINYSTDEQVVGTWIDGKPLYQKTFNCGALLNNQTKEVSFTENMETAFITNAFASSTNEGYIISLPDVVPNYVTGSVRIYINKTSKKICIYSQADMRTYDNSYVTVQYTKAS